jgi:tetratricopeptide (TPR) repeat protein
MADSALAGIELLEKRVQADPNSSSAWEDLFGAFCTEELVGHPRRIDNIVQFVRRLPRHYIARTPWVGVHPNQSPDGFRRVESEWVAHLRDFPNDAAIARGFAAFVASGDRHRAVAALRSATTSNPKDADLWMDMGRLSPDPVESLGFLQQARRLGAQQPNLTVWIGRAALDAGNLEVAAEIGDELLALTRAARSVHGDRLDWTERGRDLWSRARALLDDDAGARELTQAINDHANRHHWGHTFLGVVAARRGNVDLALDHLRLAAAVLNDFRLTSYGPSFHLARELAGHARWELPTQ